MVYLKGGNDAYNTFVPLNDAHYRKLRPTIAIARDQTAAALTHQATASARNDR